MVYIALIMVMLLVNLSSCVSTKGDYASLNRVIQLDVKNKKHIKSSYMFNVSDEAVHQPTLFSRSVSSVGNHQKWVFTNSNGCVVEHIANKQGIIIGGKILSDKKSCLKFCYYCSSW